MPIFPQIKLKTMINRPTPTQQNLRVIRTLLSQTRSLKLTEQTHLIRTRRTATTLTLNITTPTYGLWFRRWSNTKVLTPATLNSNGSSPLRQTRSTGLQTSWVKLLPLRRRPIATCKKSSLSSTSSTPASPAEVSLRRHYARPSWRQLTHVQMKQ